MCITLKEVTCVCTEENRNNVTDARLLHLPNTIKFHSYSRLCVKKSSTKNIQYCIKKMLECAFCHVFKTNMDIIPEQKQLKVFLLLIFYFMKVKEARQDDEYIY